MTREQKDPLESPELKVPEETQARMGMQEGLDHLDKLVLLVKEVLQVVLVPEVSKECLDLQERMGLLEMMEHLEFKESWE